MNKPKKKKKKPFDKTESTDGVHPTPVRWSGHNFFDKANPDIVLGGLIQNRFLTEKRFLAMLQVITLATTAPISRLHEGMPRGIVSMAVDTRLDARGYLVGSEGKLST